MKSKAIIWAVCLAVISSVSCKKTDSTPSTPGGTVTATKIKLLSYNVLYGMQYDEKKDWANWVEWVRQQDPDIFCVIEATFDEEEFADLAKRFGHQFYYLDTKHTTFSVGMTSKYPIEIMDDTIYNDDKLRGVFWARVQGLNIIPLHLYYAQTLEGDAYRVTEMNLILKKTIKAHTEYDHWVMCGDFNDQTKEDGRWSTLNPTRKYELHQNIKAAGYYDCVRLMNPDDWCRTMQTVAHEGSGGTYRLDYIYATKNLSDCLTEAGRIKDSFTDVASDHYPVYAIFDLTKLK